MTLEMLGMDTLKVTIDKEELESQNVTPMDIARNSYEAQKLLCKIILLAASECDFRPVGDKYTVEVFSNKDNCIIYISLIISRKQICKRYIVCQSNNIKDISMLCLALMNMRCSIVCSSLFSDDTKYIIAIKCQNESYEAIKSIMSEFGNTDELTELQLMSIAEHATTIFRKSAIEIISTKT